MMKKQTYDWRITTLRLLTALSLIPWLFVFGFIVMLYDAGPKMSSAATQQANTIVLVWLSYPLIFLITYFVSRASLIKGDVKKALIVSTIPHVILILFIIGFVILFQMANI